ncbi:MAG TPA: ABC transporter substrate-binding protein, partial [Candidatus Thalassarchaeum sp.]|nr:ABC transporter substrate-binding protein [Candidatus Thalassarchaeum sp.]
DNSLAPQYGPIPTGFLYADTQTQVFNYNLTYAEELLETAGFIRQYDCAELANNNTVVVAVADRTGQECRLPSILRVMANEGNDYRIAMAGQLQQALGSIGVATDGDAKPWAEYLTMYYSKTFEIRFSGWAPDYLDPDNYWSPFASSTEDVYGTGYHNQAVDDALAAAKA